MEPKRQKKILLIDEDEMEVIKLGNGYRSLFKTFYIRATAVGLGCFCIKGIPSFIKIFFIFRIADKQIHCLSSANCS